MYENIAAAWYDGQAPVEFLTVYREEEYIRQNTQGMNPEEARKFALNYYGWDEEDPNFSDQSDMFDEFEGEDMQAEHRTLTKYTQKGHLSLPR